MRHERGFAPRGRSPYLFGDSYIIQGVSLEVPAGKVVALLGRNGAGKTTTLRSIMRMVRPRRGRVTFEGRDITTLATYQIARSHIAFVQETRAILPSLSVQENLAIAVRPVPQGGWTMERVFAEFPNLAARRSTAACNCPAASSRCWRLRARSWRIRD
jgi:branched-chain amino acid transport system ATP-binding protein